MQLRAIDSKTFSYAIIHLINKGCLPLKMLVVFTDTARPPPPAPGKGLVVQNRQKNHKIA